MTFMKIGKIQFSELDRSTTRFVRLLVLILLIGTGLIGHVLADPPKKPIKVLMVGGGASHDFDTWYKGRDVAILQAKNFAAVTYTDDTNTVLDQLSQADVLYLTNNQPFTDPRTREAIMEFVESGKGLVLAHAALWYNWADWPEYNLKLVSGGSRGHDKYGPFEVTVTDKKHPVMKGVPTKFTLKDELYYYKEDPNGPGIKVLATAKSDKPDTFPSVFVINHPQAKIVGIALGHDGESHDLEAYQKMLTNAIRWVAK